MSNVYRCICYIYIYIYIRYFLHWMLSTQICSRSFLGIYKMIMYTYSMSISSTWNLEKIHLPSSSDQSLFQNKSVLRTKHKKTNKGYFTPPQLPKTTSAKQTPAVDHNGLNCPSRSKIQDFEKKNMKNHCGFIQKFRSQDHHLQPGEFPHANCHSFDRIRIPPLHQTPRLLIPEKPRSYGPQMRLWIPQKTAGQKKRGGCVAWQRWWTLNCCLLMKTGWWR